MDALKKWKGEMDSAKNWIGEMDASKGSIEAKGKMVASKKWVGEMDASKGPGWIHLEAAGSTPFNKSAWFDAPPIVEPVIPKPTKSSLAVAAGSNLLKVLFKVIKVYERLYTVDDDQTKYTFSELRSLIADVKRGLLSLEQEPVQSNRARVFA